MSSKPWKVVLLSALAVVGCGRIASDADDAADAVETTESTSNESALMDLATVEGMSCNLTSERVAELAEARLKNNVKASACVTALRAGNTVDYTMTACTGRFGKVTITGVVKVVYTANADCSVDAHATGTGITVNKATIDLDATAHFTRDANGVEKIVVQTQSKGGNANVTLDHTGSYTVTRDSSSGSLCRTLEGNWSTDWSAARGDVTTSTSATGLQRCAEACPAAGGKVVHNGFGGRVVTVTFDGSAVATWESNKGRSGTIDLACGQ